MTFVHRVAFGLLSLALPFAGSAGPAHAESTLVQPQTLVVDRSLSPAQTDALTLAALRYDTFWNTGDPELERLALDPAFIDRTLPQGRPQGITGPLDASATMRAAIPNLGCEVEQMIVTGDRVVAHLRFRGTFTGVFEGRRGSGQNVDFIATDIYRVAGGRITDNWHLEDNQTLMRQLGS